MTEWYFNPIMFEIGPVKAHWYGFMYAVGFLIGYWYLKYSSAGKKLNLSNSQKDNLVLMVMFGVILGGRLGYILLYNLSHYLMNPLKVFAVWEGGMSFHGGLLGVAISLIWFTKKYKVSFLEIGDVIVQIAPVGLFFAKIGNFINAELYGRVASQFCVHFPSDPENCRYPSQLLEAFLEGIVLFLILGLIGKKTKKTGVITSAFFVFYGIFRIVAEFFREPDPQIGFIMNFITQGQILSSIMVIVGLVILWKVHKGKFWGTSEDKRKHQ